MQRIPLLKTLSIFLMASVFITLTGCSTYTYRLDETAIHPNQPVKVTHTEKMGWSGLPSEVQERPKVSFMESMSTPQVTRTTPTWPEGARTTSDKMIDISSAGGHIVKISLHKDYAD